MKNYNSRNSIGTVLSCHNLSVGYKNSIILSGINLEFGAGQFISLLGPNGAGKTTLLRTLSRHLKPIFGSIQLGSRSIASLRQEELAKVMAVVLTDKVTPPLFSSFEFVALGRYPHTDFLGRLTKKDQAVVHDSLAAVHAEDLKHREFTSLSDGEKQKVLVARALAQEPEIMLLDEPTAHLDLKHRVEVMSILRSLCATKKITVIASLHDVDIAAKVSDQVALIKDGSITGWGPPEEVLGSREVAELYDFDSACFDRRLGSIELRGEGNKGKVFVVGGMGSGASVFRLLSKSGYNISTGVLFDNDLDCYVAKSLGVNCASQKPADTIGKASLDTAMIELQRCDCVVDAGCNCDGIYHNNLQLLETAYKNGKPIFSLSNRQPAFSAGDSIDSIIHLERVSDLPHFIAFNLEKN